MIGGVLLYLSTRGVSWQAFKGELADIAVAWVALALLFYWLELGLRIFRWRFLLSRLRPAVTGSQVTIAFISGYAANNVLPAKLGEALRADLLGRLANVSRLATFGSIIVERLFDMVVILGMTGLGILFATTADPETLARVNKGLTLLAAPVAILAIAVVFLATRENSQLNLRVKALTTKFHNLVQGLHALRDSSSYFRLVFHTLLIWLLNSLAMWCLLMALDVQLTLSEMMLLVGLTGISAAIPAAPAGIGTLQYAFYIASVLFEFSPTAALVAASLVQVVLLGSATLVGALAYSYAISTHLLPRKKGETVKEV